MMRSNSNSSGSLDSITIYDQDFGVIDTLLRKLTKDFSYAEPTKENKNYFLRQFYKDIACLELGQLKTMLRLMFAVQAKNPALYPGLAFPYDMFKRAEQVFKLLRKERGFFDCFTSYGNTYSWQKACHMIKQEIMQQLLHAAPKRVIPKDEYMNTYLLLNIHTGRMLKAMTCLELDTASSQCFRHEFYYDGASDNSQRYASLFKL